jgi:methionyl-tRNA synthetase
MFLPAMLEGLQDNWVAPNRMVSAEYLLMNNEKISKSKSGNSFDALNWANEYNTDTLRYFFTVSGPEKKDTNFSLDLYKSTHNEVVNKFGNLVNRTLKYKGLEEIPVGNVDTEIKNAIEECYKNTAREIENIEFKKAGGLVMDLIELGNKYFDERKPWVQIKEDINAFNDTIYTCAYLIANLSNLIEPFMPKSAKKIREYLSLEGTPSWNLIETFNTKIDVSSIEPLFTRM